MTTDTHFVNTLSNGYNPVGLTKREEIINYIKISIKDAINDLEPVEVGCSVERIVGLNTFGPNNSIELLQQLVQLMLLVK